MATTQVSLTDLKVRTTLHVSIIDSSETLEPIYTQHGGE